jgi:hypothetical protein
MLPCYSPDACFDGTLQCRVLNRLHSLWKHFGDAACSSDASARPRPQLRELLSQNAHSRPCPLDLDFMLVAPSAKCVSISKLSRSLWQTDSPPRASENFWEAESFLDFPNADSGLPFVLLCDASHQGIR